MKLVYFLFLPVYFVSFCYTKEFLCSCFDSNVYKYIIHCFGFEFKMCHLESLPFFGKNIALPRCECLYH